MTLHFYNTKARIKEPFKPLNVDCIKMYVCGPTVYDRAHLGNARSAVVFDMMFRLLKLLYKNVIYVRNITDIDDKIINESIKTQRSVQDITHATTAYYHQDMTDLNVLMPTQEPRATAYVEQMINFITKLINKNYAYVAEGHVLFDVTQVEDYGTLSGCHYKDIIAGSRVEVAPYKRNAVDFVLWKPSAAHIIGWSSPWGRGRPGWHIECSTMAYHELGESFDIHGGGQDLIFPHHENEKAQSTALLGPNKFAQTWLHNGILTVNGEKMSKSLGNFITVEDLLKQADGEVIRMAILSTHYRQPLAWSDQSLIMAKKSLDRFYRAFDLCHENEDRRQHNESTSSLSVNKIDENVLKALQDDLNTPAALAHMHDLVGQINNTTDLNQRQELQNTLKASANLMGFLFKSPITWWQNIIAKDSSILSHSEIDHIIEDRRQARTNKDFTKADGLRQHLFDHGIIIEDNANGTVWRRV